MATKKKGVITNYSEWAKHLRPFFKKVFWSKERGNVKRLIRKESQCK